MVQPFFKFHVEIFSATFWTHRCCDYGVFSDFQIHPLCFSETTIGMFSHSGGPKHWWCISVSCFRAVFTQFYGELAILASWSTQLFILSRSIKWVSRISWEVMINFSACIGPAVLSQARFGSTLVWLTSELQARTWLLSCVRAHARVFIFHQDYKIYWSGLS